MSEFRVWDKILVPVIITTIDGSNPPYRVEFSADAGIWLNDDDIKDAIIIERDGVPVPAPGDLVEHSLGKAIVVGFYGYDLRLHECENSYFTSGTWNNSKHTKVIGRNGKLLPEDKGLSEFKRDILNKLDATINANPLRTLGETVIKLRELRNQLKEELEGENVDNP